MLGGPDSAEAYDENETRLAAAECQLEEAEEDRVRMVASKSEDSGDLELREGEPGAEHVGQLQGESR